MKHQPQQNQHNTRSSIRPALIVLGLSLFSTILYAADLPSPAIQLFYSRDEGGKNSGSAILGDTEKFGESAVISENKGETVAESNRKWSGGMILTSSQAVGDPLYTFTRPPELSAEAISSGGGLTLAFWMDASEARAYQRVIGDIPFVTLVTGTPEARTFQLRVDTLRQPDLDIHTYSAKNFVDNSGWAFYTIVIPVNGVVEFYRNGEIVSSSERPMMIPFDASVHNPYEELSPPSRRVVIGGQPTQSRENDAIMRYSNLMIFTQPLSSVQVSALYEKQFSIKK